MSSEKFNPFKDFQSDQIQRSSRKIFTAHCAYRNADFNLTLFRDGPLENLLGGGGEVQKKYSRKAKLNEKKIHARQLTLNNIHATA